MKNTQRVPIYMDLGERVSTWILAPPPLKLSTWYMDDPLSKSTMSFYTVLSKKLKFILFKVKIDIYPRLSGSCLGLLSSEKKQILSIYACLGFYLLVRTE